MDTVNHLRDLLSFGLRHLRSAEELQAILDEEHEANDLLTELAEGGINHRAELGDIPNDSRDL